ncbi:MAG: hypothetical protein KJZ83_00235 [Burkholderiaceae bacterium]|nr:hypothetical protein [Burkholderiaceae bacterium]
MALKFAKKAATPGGATTNAPPSTQTPTKSSFASHSSGAPSFLKKGAAAKKALAHEEAQAELRKQEQGRMWRFYLKEGEDRQITFLDGELDAEGMLDIFMFYEHNVRVNGDWQQFVCTSDVDQTQPCPICEKGERSSFVGVMTIIDHSEYVIKKGPNAGKKVANQRKLFVAKQGTIKHLTKLAAKRGGLAGCTFDVSRTGDKEPGVGNQYDFVQKFDSYEEIAAKYGMKVEDVHPANYAEEIRFRSPEELIELGVGKALGGPGFEKGASNVKDEL